MRFSTSWPRLAIIAAIAVPILVGVVVERSGTLTRRTSDPMAEARALVLKEIAPKVPGFAVAVAVDGRIVWSEGFGYADLAAKKPVTTKTRFRVGSIAKPFTAAGLMLLVERGQFDLDAPVQKYVPAFPDKAAVITTRRLAGHLGGIRHYRGNEMLLNRPFATVSDGLSIFQDEPLAAPPGTKYIYSTYGWTLISAAMEAAAQKEFLGFMDANVFRPLGMAHTRPDHADVVDPDRTLFYRNNDAGQFIAAPTVNSSYKWAGGGFLSTVEDLVRFGSAHLQPGFLRAESLAVMFTSQKSSDGKSTEYGIGWRVLTDARGHRVMLHTGGSVGGTSVLLLHPETRTVVAMACNHSQSPFKKENYEAIAELFAPLFTKD
jgi:serine beta-lactamase-like protein LACTB